MSKILLLEDDLSLINGLSFAFKKQGFEPYIARTLKEADALWADGKYDLLVLDVSLPDGSGFEFCKKVRQVSKVPIIFLTASDEETNIIMGLDIGGDDYITKPFKLGVLESRVNALLRRANSFNAADTELQMEQARLVGKHGNFSIGDLLGSSMGQTLLSVAVVLFLLILIAGVLMISSSMNSSVAQRIKFFGMMRCIGMSKQQIIRFVRLEALNWCKTAVPIGLILGVVTTWGLCAVLRFVVREEFSNIPLFGISIFGIACGIFVGVITVLIAANAPAKRASKVSPIAAVSGNAGNEKTMRHSAHTRFGRIETILGINHAISVKKNLILMTGSFALSIILFLSFSVMVNFVDYLIPQSTATSDIDIASTSGNSIPHELLASIRGMDGVKEVYGRRSTFDVPAGLNGDTSLSGTVDLISYDDFDLQSQKKTVL